MKALLLENIHSEATRILTEAGLEVETRPGALGEDELIEALQGVSVLGIRSTTQLTERVIEASPDLLAAGCFCIGTNQVALGAAAAKGIPVFNAPYSNTRSVVELAIGEIIALARRLPEKNQMMHQGVWNKSANGSHEIRGRVLGIIGYGNIGAQLSVLAESLGMSVIFYDIADKLALGNARRCDSLEELLAEADLVTLHVDGRASNENFFGEEQFAMMKDRAMFLNLSRGHVYDVDALVRHLESGHIAGAGLDVFPSEPKKAGMPFESPLQNVPNVILTPHVGGSTKEAQVDIGRFVAGKLLDHVTTGGTQMSVNVPEIVAGAFEGTRVLHMHHNVPGVMARLNQVLAQHDGNITFQTLATRGAIGYAVIDVSGQHPNLQHELAELDETVRVRVI
ncbi:phosphoglycerate dehydrogenase [Luteococcus sp. Sow4_B9]|uniref:phosphoglycerate dehydrogenase n=1 Tax=Luteococcus sp. Sow4_B9 TaxID=3438792 RepID=UPI003F976714